jgi:hypothetical protein
MTPGADGDGLIAISDGGASVGTVDGVADGDDAGADGVGAADPVGGADGDSVVGDVGATDGVGLAAVDAAVVGAELGAEALGVTAGVGPALAGGVVAVSDGTGDAVGGIFTTLIELSALPPTTIRLLPSLEPMTVWGSEVMSTGWSCFGAPALH